MSARDRLPNARATFARGPRVNVLVIDDSESARAGISAVLVNAGFPVFELPSAIGASRTILRNNIGAVVVDVSMPGLSGDKLVTVLRKNGALSTLAIIVVSSDAAQLALIANDPGIDAVIPKSAIATELVAAIERHVGAPRRESAPGRPGA